MRLGQEVRRKWIQRDTKVTLPHFLPTPMLKTSALSIYWPRLFFIISSSLAEWTRTKKVKGKGMEFHPKCWKTLNSYHAKAHKLSTRVTHLMSSYKAIWHSLLSFSFLKSNPHLRICVLIWERERKEEGERERHSSMWEKHWLAGCLLYMPWLGITPANFQGTRWRSKQRSHLARAIIFFVLF